MPLLLMTKRKKIFVVTSASLGGVLLLCLGFVGVVATLSHNRALRIDASSKITNTTGLIQQSGKALYDKDGNYILLRGVNAGNLLVSEGWMSPYSVGEALNEEGQIIYDHDSLPTYPSLPMEETLKGFASNPNLTDAQRDELWSIYRDNWFGKSDFSFVKGMGMNVIRLPFYWRDILNEENGVYSRKEEKLAFGYIDSFLENCKEAGLYCILDLHGAPGGQNGYEHSGDTTKADLWKEEKYQEATCDLWSYVASHYLQTRPDLAPVIASYDILNEPCSDYSNPGNGTDPSICYPVFDKIYKAIRETGDKHVITIEAVWSYDCFMDPKQWGWENIMHETHMYNWDHDKVPYWIFNGYHEIRNWGHDYDVPFFMGEFTFFENGDAWKQQLAMYEKRGYSWTMWSYKGSTTGWWTSSWTIYTQPLSLWEGKKKINLAKDSYDDIKVAFEATNSSNCQLSNTYTYINEFIQGQKG